MSLPAETRRSLDRLRELEKLSQPPRPRFWYFPLFKIKSDNLFLLTLVSTLICLGCLLVIFVQDRTQHEQQAKERQAQVVQATLAPRTCEIPLGSFESISRNGSENGEVSVLQYEAFITTKADFNDLKETESLLLNHKQRLRATVEVVMHKATDEALKEPSLRSVRTALVEKLNDVVGFNVVQDVQFSNFLHFHVPDTK